jgi:tetratricopeptide (TPR) repeat protein
MRAGLVHALVLACMATLGSACHRADPPARDEPAPISEAANTSAPGADQTIQEPTLAANGFRPLTEDQRATAQAALRAQLDAGHAAVQANDHATGIARLQQAAAINPIHAETLAELGAAYVSANELEAAAQMFDKALHHAKDPQTRAVILDQLGRVAEARGDVSLATEHYTHSLGLQHSDALAARLASLTGGIEVISHSECSWIPRGPAPLHLCHAYVQTLEHEEHPPTCAYERTRPAAPGESSAATIYDLELDADAKVAVFSYLDHDRSIEIFVLNAVLAGIWSTTELTWVDHGEVTYADETLADLELRTEQLAPGGLPELVIEWTVHGHGEDLLDATEAVWSADRLGVLMLHRGTPRWLIGLTRASTYSYGEIGGEDPEPRVRSIELEWLTKTGEIELRAGEHEPSAPIGRFALGGHPQLCPAENERL